MHSAKIARVGSEGNVECDLEPSTLYHMHHITQEVSLEEYYASSRDEGIVTQLLCAAGGPSDTEPLGGLSEGSKGRIN